ncbi:MULTISPECIES: putative zinc-binding metallopeptidase [unclassified Ectothiorhodospira]|uniref:zinc-binding metallopeptidase family protein n=1 Tax=unclassified Ectothiorhodospira TaxID=2684909 RepID=UPI001EE7D03D|nr:MULTISPECIES: putative zinc-binding peptidase [unclassified Ectothiorhodospira]MCG5517153.1 putative zinc-binding peptidase [Ectothiorhodospira sp. 9100]MCG5520032.1 putative zinc-binding peptidase [Ectothiorhodospira sp. 9905]
MRLFNCGSCGQLIYFENTSCTRCGHTLGFLPDTLEVAALEPEEGGLWRPLGAVSQGRYRMCNHYARDAVCNWMVPVEEDEGFCAACRLNQVIPDLGVPGNKTLWYRLETEKRRLIYSLLRLKLPVVPRSHDPSGLAFAFMADVEPQFFETERVMTGHARGLITINVAEADPATRERLREKMAEPYRTILGHFRHESGHYYWERMIRDTPWLETFRARFGDEREDYAQALQRHYRQGPPSDWGQHFISSYASSHPWEDWAETWAHYLHIIDTLETAHAWGLEVGPRLEQGAHLRAAPDFDPYEQREFTALVDHWLPLTYALNSLNRSMGHSPAYPFVLSPKVVEKMTWIHRIVGGERPA